MTHRWRQSPLCYVSGMRADRPCLPAWLENTADPLNHTLRHRTQERWGEAARRLANVLNDDTFRSIEGKSKHQLWLELCDLITKHPADVIKERIDVDAILRGGIRKYKDEVGLGAFFPLTCTV